jgi:hypothetical protein
MLEGGVQHESLRHPAARGPPGSPPSAVACTTAPSASCEGGMDACDAPRVPGASQGTSRGSSRGGFVTETLLRQAACQPDDGDGWGRVYCQTRVSQCR